MFNKHSKNTYATFLKLLLSNKAKDGFLLDAGMRAVVVLAQADTNAQLLAAELLASMINSGMCHMLTERLLKRR